MAASGRRSVASPLAPAPGPGPGGGEAVAASGERRGFSFSFRHWDRIGLGMERGTPHRSNYKFNSNKEIGRAHV